MSSVRIRSLAPAFRYTRVQKDDSVPLVCGAWVAHLTGIPTINPPVITPPYEDNPLNGLIYQSYVPKVDSDGNDIAGIRLPELTVPLATYTGWALRSGVWANDGSEGSGQYS